MAGIPFSSLTTTCDVRSGRGVLGSAAQAGPTCVRTDDRTVFENAIRALEAEVSNAGAHLFADASARQSYTRQIAAVTRELRARVESGALTWRQAAELANEERNTIMEIVRGRSTPVGRAMAESLKTQGKTLNELIARKAAQLFGKDVKFAALTVEQQNAVYGAIVESAGTSNPKVTATMLRMSRAGRALIVVSLAISVYNIATSDDKIGTAEREVAVTGAGIAGGVAGGALAGLACGPGAPVCVTVGAFVGGALAAFGVDHFW